MLLLIKNTLIKLYIVKVYNKFNIIIIFNEIRVKESYKEKIIFFIKYNLFKYIIIFFNLYNTPATF